MKERKKRLGRKHGSFGSASSLNAMSLYSYNSTVLFVIHFVR